MLLAAVLLATAAVTANAVRAIDVKLLPKDTELVFTVNLKQILESEIVKSQKEALDQVKAMFQQGVPGAEDATKYLKKAGFDPFKDLHSVTIAMPASKDPEAGFIIVEGKFSPEMVQAAAEEAAKDQGDIIKVTWAGKQTIYEIAPPGEKKVYATLLEGRALLAASSKEGLSDALARAAGTKKSEIKKEIKELLETTNNKQSISFVATGNAINKLIEDAPIPNGNQFGPLLQQVSGMSGAITINKDISFQLGVGAGDEESAKKMAQGARFGLVFANALVQQKVKEDEKLAPVMDIMKTLKVTSQGNSVLLRGEVTMEVIMKLKDNFQPK
jgi:hypothetical protein